MTDSIISGAISGALVVFLAAFLGWLQRKLDESVFNDKERKWIEDCIDQKERNFQVYTDATYARRSDLKRGSE